jgi:hypothetical protein
LIEEARKHITLLYNEVARLAEQELSPPDFYGEFLKRVLLALSAPAGAVWLRTSQGHLQLQYQVNLREVGLEQSEASRQSHDELLRQAFQQGRPFYLPPHSSMGTAEAGGPPVAGNTSDYLVLLAPVRIEQQVVGLVEVWQRPDHPPNAVPGFMQLLVRMADLASQFTRKNHMRQMAGQQQLWTQLEAFARQIHGTLNPTEVAYLVANEGRRLVECDRLSVAVRHSRRAVIEAISGADVVEKRSNLVQLMRALCEHVLRWGEKLVYRGSRDDSLPPAVVQALDEYLAESPSKLLVVQPLKDEREKDSKQPPRSALVMESFEPAVAPEQLVTRLDVVGKHATSALYNAAEHRRIPFRWIWMPLARLREGVGGTARAVTAGVAAALVLLVAALVFIPYPLKMDAKGNLLPEERRWLYSPGEGQVVQFQEGVDTASFVLKDQSLVLMHDLQLAKNLVQLNHEIWEAQGEIESYSRLMGNASTTEAERQRFQTEKRQKEFVLERKIAERQEMMDRYHADPARPGYFWLKSPIDGTILNSDFKETLGNKMVKPSDPLLRIGAKDKAWEVELKIPQKHVGQVLQAFKPNDPRDELDVDLLLATHPTRVFKGKLARDKIGGEASPNRDDPSDSEPVVLAWVRIDGPGIAEADRLPREYLDAGTEVHAKVRCRNHSLGYSLFYGVWEFFYEKVVFFF